MLFYAFFFENILIPVSKSFKMKDDNGALGMKSSLYSLSASLTFYSLILILIGIIKHYYVDTENSEIYIAIYNNFN